MRLFKKITRAAAIIGDIALVFLITNKKIAIVIRSFCDQHKLLGLLIGVMIVAILNGPYIYMYIHERHS